MGFFKTCLSIGLGTVFEYETKKVVQIKSKKIGVIFRVIQIAIIGYILGWVMLYKKGYQDTDTVVSAVLTKVKGISLTNRTDMGLRIWDVADYVVPAQEKDATFITTNAVITIGQAQGTCPEDTSVFGARCNDDSDCIPMEPLMLGHGAMTGRCVPSDLESSSKSCEIYAWCPVENDFKTDSPLLQNAVNFTIYIKNSVEFPKFNKKRSNVLSSYNTSTLMTCNYDPVKDPYCPIFRLGTILELTESSFDEIAVEGGVIAVSIHWDCNFDWNERYCLPKYSFHRLDTKEADVARGWNFRYASYYEINGTQHRNLIKAYGIRLLVFVTGQGGQFSFVPLTMNLGSGLALLGIATILCDMVVLYCLNRKDRYRKAKYQTVYGEDAFRTGDSGSHLSSSLHDSLGNPHTTPSILVAESRQDDRAPIIPPPLNR